ncbi:MAG: hypothetical protein BWK76_06335 [Desulfobulbaceae bacterium A2]|nr:MAG: hypothetical protein BWK76_06335 [Desulfobulbaceae bacterium A2]
MSWQDSEEYKKAKAWHDRMRAIEDKLRLESPQYFTSGRDLALDAFELVRLEMLYADGHTTTENALFLSVALATLVYKWKKEQNPYYMDKALMICATWGVIPSPALLEAITEAAAKRYRGGQDVLKATAGSIEREAHKQHAFLVMMNLIFNGETLERAASKTSQWMKDTRKVKPIKASTLDKYYVKEIRKTGIEKKRFETWSRLVKEYSDEERQQWAQNISLMPEAEYYDCQGDPESLEGGKKYLKGSRR